jgi:cyclophilin family peptidyl-prolyl cis-trans isomerase/HEAT repeat protein
VTRTSLSLALVAVVTCPLLASAQETTADRVRAVLELEDLREPKPEAWEPFVLDEDRVVAGRAVRAIGRSRLAALAPLLRRALAASTAPADEVAFALGLCADPASIDPLLALATTHEDARARAAAALALGRQGATVPLAALLPVLRDPSPEVRGAGLLALARLRGRRVTPKVAVEPVLARALLERLKAALEDADEGVRWRAAYACFELDALEGDDRTRLPLLLGALKSEDPAARLFAARALGSMPAEHATAAVKAVLGRLQARESDPHVAAALVTALARAALTATDSGAEPFDAAADLLASVARPKLDGGPLGEHHVRRAALQALPDLLLARPDAAPARAAAFKALATDARGDVGSRSVRGDVLVALARLSDDPLAAADSTGEYLRALVDENALGEHPLDRMAAARAARYFRPARPVLERLLTDADPRVACEALGALGEIASVASATDAERQAVRRAARQAAKHADLAVHTTGVSLLGEHGELGDVATIAAVASRASGPANAEVRVECANALKALGAREDLKPAAIAALRAALRDEAPAVQAAVAKALGELTGEPVELPPAPPTRSTVTLEVGVDVLSSAPNPRAALHTTKGTITLELLREEAPRHVKSFLTLARRGLYDGLRFHRIVSGFVAQGLDPRGDGWGSGGVLVKDEVNQVPYLAGAVGMPNSGPDTGGCQLFIMHVPAPHLDGNYTVFARVVDGMEVVHALDLDDVVDSVEVLGGR